MMIVIIVVVVVLWPSREKTIINTYYRETKHALRDKAKYNLDSPQSVMSVGVQTECACEGMFKYLFPVVSRLGGGTT